MLASKTASLMRQDGRVVCEHLLVAARPLRRMRGLLGRRSLPEGEGILLRPAGSIHTFFMRFAIDAVFLDRDLVVVGIEPSARPRGGPRAGAARRRSSSSRAASARAAGSSWATLVAVGRPSSSASSARDAERRLGGLSTQIEHSSA